jgi:predicted dienelactone hydrolase
MSSRQSAIWRQLSWLVAALSVTVLGPVAVLSQEATPETAAVELPPPTGPFTVGRTSFDWADANRIEPFTEDRGDVRELVVWVWYPAAPSPDVEPAAYLPGAWGEQLAPILGFDPERIMTHSVVDAPFATTEPSFPILIFSPGSGFFPAVYAALAEELASHGNVIVGVTHSYNSTVTVFDDGRVVPTAPEAQPLPPDAEGQGGTGTAITELHAADLRFVLDQVEDLNRESSPFAGRLDLSRIGVFGHSLGGAAAAEMCRVDRRCDAGVNMDGGLWGEAAATGVAAPFLLLMANQPTCAELAETGLTTVAECEAARSILEPGWETAYASAQPGYWLEIAGSRHGSFSDLSFLPIPAELVAPFLGGATIAPDRMWRVTSDVLLAFFDRHLNGSPAPLLAGPSAKYPEIKFVSEGS